MADSNAHSMYDSAILIVDDDNNDRALVSEALARAGFTAVFEANRLEEAVWMLERRRFELILTEMILPDGTDHAIIEELMSAAGSQSPIYIALTSINHPSQRMEWFRAGIVDLLLKPVFTEELIIKIEMHLQRQVAYMMLANYHNRVSAELSAARHMQHSLLPSDETLDTVTHTHGIQIHSAFLPTAEMAGDLWGLFACDESTLALYSCDVVGHGVVAAIQSFRIHAMLRELSPLADTPDALLNALNNKLSDLFERGQFATFFYCVIDITNHTLTYASAGAPSPLLYSHSQQEVKYISGEGLPLGIRRNQVYEAHAMPFHAQDTLLLYSDALIENDHCDETRLMEWVDDYMQYGVAQTGQNMKDYIMKTLATPYMPTLEDDLTVITVVANG